MRLRTILILKQVQQIAQNIAECVEYDCTLRSK